MGEERVKSKKEFGERVYEFALALIAFVDRLPKDGVSRIIRDQLVRSGTSIGANYIEAQSASSKKDFANSFNHSLKSANESRYWLTLLRDSGRAPKEDVEALLRELSEIARVIASSIITAKGKRR